MKLRFNVYAIVLFLSLKPIIAQNLQGYVKDKNTNEILPFASISINNSSQGVIANKEGVFSINRMSDDNFIIVSFVGYIKKKVLIADLKNHSTVYLEPIRFDLSEVVIHGNLDYLFDIMNEARNQLSKSEYSTCKTYMQAQSEEQKEPVEFLECYFNAKMNESRIFNLQMKNGRAGFIINDDVSFQNLSLSKFFTHFELFYDQYDFPFTPFSLNKSQLKKQYKLESHGRIGDSLINIEFKPENNEYYFQGNVWIDLKDYSLVSLNLLIQNTKRFPLIAKKKGDEIKNIDFSLSYTYKQENGINRIESIRYSYQFEYLHLTSHRKNSSIFRKRKISSTGVLHIFDCDEQFYIPTISYNDNISDYQQIALTSHNHKFWDLYDGIVKTQSDKDKLNHLRNNGELLNFNSNKKKLQNDSCLSHGDFGSMLWDNESRIKIENDIAHNTPDRPILPRRLKDERYRIEVQIYLDINKIEGGIQHYSGTVLDLSSTYWLMSIDPNANVFLNIYFDLCEIERRKMEKEIVELGDLSVDRLNAIYSKTIEKMQLVINEFLTVEHAHQFSLRKMRFWNEYVVSNLGINNFDEILYETE